MRFGLCLMALLVAAASPAFADSEGSGEDAAAIEKAKKLNDDAVAHFNLGEYPEAIQAWQEAYRLRPRTHLLLFNIAQSQRMLQSYDAAARSYRAFLAQSPNLPAGERANIQQHIAEMDAAAAAERAKNPSTPSAPSEQPNTEAAPQPVPGTPEPPPTTTTTTPPAAAGAPLYKRWWLWTAVGAAVVIAIGVGAGVGAAPAQNAANPGGTAGSLAVKF
jgi:tetratricopeptide (TPR) repeat protein